MNCAVIWRYLPRRKYDMSSLLKCLRERMYDTMDISDVHLSNGLIHSHINPATSPKPFVTLVVCDNGETAT